MKKLIIAWLLLCGGASFAQRETDTIWRQQINEVFQNIDKKRIPEGLLLDYAMEFTNVPAYNGKLTDSTFVDLQVFGNIYKTLYMAQADTDTLITQNFPKIQDVSQSWMTLRQRYNDTNPGTVVLGGLFYQYNRINKDAKQNHKIADDGKKYHDVFDNGIWQNPYDTLQTVAFAPPVKMVEKLKFKVVLPADLFLSNHIADIDKIKVDFQDGHGEQQLVFGQPMEVSYAVKGVYKWTFTITLQSGTELYSHAKVMVSPPVLDASQSAFANNILIPGASGNGYGATLRIDYAPGHNGQIKKPFIVAEGFDVGSILTPEVTGGDRTLFPHFKEDLLSSGPQLFSLLDGLTTQQYDIIYVDWKNGTASIQHNAAVLRNVLAWVNAQKQVNSSTHQNVILGQSMGGLITRYCLKKMEDDNVPHDVRLYVAHDSPLQGANFPISMQYFARHMYDLYTDSPVYPAVEAIPTILNFAELMSLGLINVDLPSLSDVLTLNDTPAAMQMMYYWVDMSSDPTDDVHAIWQQEFETLGYPQNCRNVAISNGNECASEYPFLPRDKFISLHDTHNPGFFGDLLHLAVTPLIGIAIDDIELAILGAIPGSSEYFFDFDLHANPESVGNPRKVYGGKLRYEKRLLWLVPVTHTITDRNEIAPVGFLPFDVYSGGGITLSETIPSSILGSLPSNTIVNDTYGFIPVVSSLDIKRSNGNVNQSDYKKRYAGGLTPETALTTAFDNFIVDYNSNGENAPHISFQARNGNWLAAEMQVNLTNPVYPIYDCSKFCSENAITGSPFLCGSQTYSVTNEATYAYWTVTHGSSLVNVSISANQITLTPVSTNTKGWVTIAVNFSNSSCSGQSEMDIWVGRPEITNHNLNGFTSVVKNSSTGYSVNSPGQGITGYEWTITPSVTNCGCTTNSQGLTTCPSNITLPKFTNGLTTLNSTIPYAIVNVGNCPGSYLLQMQGLQSLRKYCRYGRRNCCL